jgi:hypothetical protein
MAVHARNAGDRTSVEGLEWPVMSLWDGRETRETTDMHSQTDMI